tara:strand:+ start:7894 stop:8661 length:768 start_codon:yes stop_codon:yes gene_type:complete
MNVDFTNDIIKLKQREVAHKPFRQSNSENVCIFEQREDKMVKVVFENVESTAKYLDHLGYEWDQKEYDSEMRLLRVLPELESAEVVAADPQWNVDNLGPQTPKESNLDSTRKVEDIPDLAVELREVDHPIGFDERSQSSEEKDYSELWEKTNAYAPRSMMGYNKFMKGDMVKNINPDCKHYQSEGEIVGVKNLYAYRNQMPIASESEALDQIEDMMGCAFAYMTTNDGPNWTKGEVLEKTPDQLELIEGMMNPRF